MPTPLTKIKKPPPSSKSSSTSAVQKEPVEVYGRLRPLKTISSKTIIKKFNDEILEIQPPLSSNTYRFRFKHLFDQKSTQNDIFQQIGSPLVYDLIHGHNGLIFTYGVTSSGKTYTITGSPQNCGLIPRVLDMIFNTLDRNNLQSLPFIFKPDSQNGFQLNAPPDAVKKIQENLLSNHSSSPKIKKRIVSKPDELNWENRVKEESFVKDIDCDFNYAVFVSYIEIYNNYIHDLLEDQQNETVANENNGAYGLKTNSRLKRIMEDSRKRNYVQGVKEIEVRSANDACDLLIKGINKRRVGTTEMNQQSSRSHSIFNVRIVKAPLDMEGVLPIDCSKLIQISQLSIVDLAGCERIAKTKATGNRLREAGNINNSLLTLRKCFDELRENQKGNVTKMVSYRDSKLTHLFKSYFEGDGRVKMIICINPGLEDLDETIQVCKFAETSQELVTNKTAEVYRYPFRMIKIAKSNIDYTSWMIPTVSFPDEVQIDPEDDKIIEQWSECVEKQLEYYNDFLNINKQNQLNVRQNIINLENELVLLKHENKTLKMDLQCREIQLQDYEIKFDQLNHDNEAQSIENEKLIAQNNDLETQLSELRSNLSKEKEQNIKLRQNMVTVLKKEYDKMMSYMCKILNSKDEELREQKQNQKIKFGLLKQIFSSEDSFEQLSLYSLEQMIMTLNSNSENSKKPNVIEMSKQLAIEPKALVPVLSNKSKTPEVKRVQNENGTKDVYVHIDPDAPPPVINPKYRRSLSSGAEKWIDHRPIPTLELGTIFKQNIKNKKLVTKLKASDFINRKNAASKYLLTHHEATETGSVETRIFKGDVIPSSAGGAQIIFHDVEMLKQESPSKIFQSK
ncbi:hypothetical protein NH340_JMT01434 [Sarcoptes scabiei]|nr:hypothetical protein NH340_JMT01434 [Sarcoptes scabiei]